ncbi:class II glutamine amidotransferase, partial [Agrobacterium tumefaciens]|nr:class II glutamine amidotransferase [Agrobacterium tumefaciens]
SGEPPTLYWRGLDDGIALSSEPFSFDCAPWCAVPPNTRVTIRAGEMAMEPFLLP